MSKNIGVGYINRMKRYHVPTKIKNPYDRLQVIVDRSFYFDGAYKYKLPRYYRDRFYRKKFPCEAKIWNKKTKVYESKTVYRYMSKNLLSLQMQSEVQHRILAEYERRVSEIRSEHPDYSDDQIHIAVLRSDEIAKKDRQRSAFTKMSRFYNTRRFQNRAF